MIHKVHFGKRIASYRKQQAWSQAELAEKLGVTSQAVSKWEGGISDPSTSNLIALAKLFDTTPEDLLKEARES